MITGVIAFGITLTSNLLFLILDPSQLCRLGPLVIPLSMLTALGAFLLLAAIAGFLAGRMTGAVSDAALTGLVMAAISGLALLAMIPFFPSAQHRFADLQTRCPQASSVGGSSNLTNGSPPPGFVPTPPPGFAPPTPPAGFVGPGPGALPSGPAETVFFAFGLLLNIGFGMGLATGAAALGGLIGTSTRSAPG